MSNPVLVMVFSKQCGACHKFKANTLPDLEKDLKKLKDVEVLKLEFPEMRVPLSDKEVGFEYHPKLSEYARWFPTFILFPDNLWFDKGSNLKGIIKDEELVTKSLPPNYSKNSILEWIEHTSKTNPLFTQKRTILNDDNKETKQNKKLNYRTNSGKIVVPTYGTYTKITNNKIYDEF